MCRKNVNIGDRHYRDAFMFEKKSISQNVLLNNNALHINKISTEKHVYRDRRLELLCKNKVFVLAALVELHHRIII